jgi:hypothetical protein
VDINFDCDVGNTHNVCCNPGVLFANLCFLLFISCNIWYNCLPCFCKRIGKDFRRFRIPIQLRSIRCFKIGICFHRGPDFGEHEGMLLSWGLWEKGKKFPYLGEFLWEIWEIRKWAALFVGPLLGNLEVVHLLGLWRGEKKSISGSLFLDPEVIKGLSVGAVWNFSKGTGLPWADIRLWGTEGPFVRPRCIRNVRGRTQMQIIVVVVVVVVVVITTTTTTIINWFMSDLQPGYFHQCVW